MHGQSRAGVSIFQSTLLEPFDPGPPSRAGVKQIRSLGPKVTLNEQSRRSESRKGQTRCWHLHGTGSHLWEQKDSRRQFRAGQCGASLLLLTGSYPTFGVLLLCGISFPSILIPSAQGPQGQSLSHHCPVCYEERALDSLAPWPVFVEATGNLRGFPGSRSASRPLGLTSSFLWRPCRRVQSLSPGYDLSSPG